MNTEQIEHELVLMKGKKVIVIVPNVGKASMSLGGELQVVQTKEFTCGFHIHSPLGGWALIFFAEDVNSIEPSPSEPLIKVVRLKKTV